MAGTGRRKIDILDTSISPGQLVAMLAWPSILEQLLQTAVNYVDTAMVGSIGVNATASIGVCSSTIWMIVGIMNAAAVGYSVMVARRIGEDRPEEARETIRQAVLTIVLVGVTLTALIELLIAPNLPVWMGAAPDIVPLSCMYFRIIGSVYTLQTGMIVCSSILRCMGDMKTPLKYHLLTNVINVAGNFLLIYPTRELDVFGVRFTMPGAGLGVKGAAIATAFSTAVCGAGLILILFLRETPYRISLKDSFRPNKAVIRQAFTLGLPSAMERLTISFGQVISTAIITGLGTVSIAAHQLSNSAESICYMPSFGFAMAATTVVGQNLGAGNREEAYRLGQVCARMASVVMAVMAVLMYVFAPNILSFFTRDVRAIELGARMLRIQAFAEIFCAVANVMNGVLRGAGDTRWPFYVSIAGMWLIRLPIALILIRGFGWDLAGIWFAMALDWVIRGTISYARFRRRKWLNAWARSERAR